MMRWILIAVCMTGLLLAASPLPASAWQNGATRDGFGTHDWILYHAMRLAGEEASWVDRNEALISTDDPDNWRDDYPPNAQQYRLEQPFHIYYPDSALQGGPQAVADHYALMVQALSTGDNLTASRELGYLSHYYADMLVPFHTLPYGSGSLEDGIDHSNYESAVDSVTRTPEANAGWVTDRMPRPMTDVRARAVEAAVFSGGQMLGLIAKHGTFEYHDPAADPQTQQLLDRAVNDLADLIRSARTGTGQPRPIASIEAWADYYNPALERPARVWVRVRDDQGRLVRGVKVNYEFQVTQPCTYTRYTDADGISRQTHQNVLGSIGVPFKVVVTATSAGTSIKRTVTLTPTEVIGAGASGIRTYTKYDRTPAQGTTVTVMTHVQKDNGQPIPGIKVVYTFRHKTGSVKKTVYTNSSGNAWHSRNVGGSTAGYRVNVRADAYGGTEPKNTFDGMRTASSYYVPHSVVASLRAYRLAPAKPSQSTTVTVKARCLDDHGKPIVGRKVRFSWKYKSRTVSMSAKTDASGNAYVSRNIGKSAAGFKVNVTASINSGSKVKKSVVAFTPVSP